MAEFGFDEVSRLGPYRLFERLGSSATTVVRRAERDGKSFAIKLLVPDLESAPVHEAAFRAEAQVGALLRHPNIVETVELGLQTPPLFLVMEMLYGRTVAALTRPRQQLPVELVIALGLQALDGLAALHDAIDAAGQPLCLVHRDIKPSNLFLTDEGRLKLFDFGTTRTQYEDNDTGVEIKGTPRYFSSEQAQDRPLDARSDLFSLALVLQELLIGEPVLSADNPWASTAQLLFGEFRLASDFRPDLPASLVSFLEACLQRHREVRPASALQMRRQLERAASGLEVWSEATISTWLRGLSSD